jgi:hypothetical protein
MAGELRADRWLPLDDQVPPQTAFWSISCPNRGLKQQWETLAKRGGDALSENDFVDAIRVWLEMLRAENVNSTGPSFIYGGDATHQGIQELITDLAEASAILCGILESAALDRERNTRAVKVEAKAHQTPAAASETPTVASVEPEAATNERRKFVESLLDAKGWSVLDWANAAHVAHATAMDYLDLKTNPYSSTRLKLAKALGIPLDQLPQ